MIEDAQKFAVQLSPSLGPKLSIFWSNRNFSEGRMRVLDRIDYIDHAKAIFENEWINPKRPTKKEIYEYLSGEPLENWRQTAAHFILQDKLSLVIRQQQIGLLQLLQGLARFMRVRQILLFR